MTSSIRENLKDRLVRMKEAHMLSQAMLANKIGITINTLKQFMAEPDKSKWCTCKKINEWLTELERAN